MSEWRGLHNPERHGQEGQGAARLWCECGSWCSENAICDCCELVELRTEVERLTATLADRDRRIDAALAVCADDAWCFDVGEHAGETKDGLPFVEVDAVRHALRGESE